MSDEFSIMEKRDEQQIIAELQGNFMKEFVYKFRVGGREVTGISWSGIKEIAYRVQGIDTVIESTEHTEDAYTFIVKATNKNISSSRLGVGSCLKKEPFAIQKALSKAQRNAIRGVIPEKTIELFLTEFTGKKDHVDTIPNADELRRQVKAEVKQPQPETTFDLSIDGIKQALIQFGYPGEDFTVRHDEPSRMYIIDKAPWIDDWTKYQNDIRELGGGYDQEHKKTVFRY